MSDFALIAKLEILHIAGFLRLRALRNPTNGRKNKAMERLKATVKKISNHEQIQYGKQQAFDGINDCSVLATKMLNFFVGATNNDASARVELDIGNLASSVL